MAGLSITRAWNEGSAFVRQEAGALFLIVFGLSVLPGIIAQVVVNGLVAAPALVPGAKPDPERLIAALGITFAAVLPAILLSLWGNLTVVLLVLRRQSVIGGALRLAAGRILPLLGASVVLLLGLLLLFLPPAAILAGAGERQPGLFALVFLLLLPIMLFVAVRVLLMTPVAAAEAAGRSPPAISRSCLGSSRSPSSRCWSPSRWSGSWAGSSSWRSPARRAGSTPRRCS
jgi:hypothetical protein